MAAKAEATGIRKAAMPLTIMFALSMLAGAFIAAGAFFSTTVVAGSTGVLPYGIIRLIGGFAFCLGLIMVIVAGAELFTGNNLIIMAWADRKVTTLKLLRNWGIVWVGNFVGAVLTALLVFASKQYTFGAGSVGADRAEHGQHEDRAWISCRPLRSASCATRSVCIAVWLCYSARSTTDKILSIIFPITAFVAAGFEHSVANMYYIPMGLLIKNYAPESFWAAIKHVPADFPNLTLQNMFVNNLIPVTIGNIIGGAVMVGLVYWFAYLRPKRF